LISNRLVAEDRTLEAMRTQGKLQVVRFPEVACRLIWAHESLRLATTRSSKDHESNWQIAIWLFGRLKRAIGSTLLYSLRR
jgi:hypothetical protein